MVTPEDQTQRQVNRDWTNESESTLGMISSDNIAVDHFKSHLRAVPSDVNEKGYPS